ncbi:MAG: hypothetical protein KBT59_11760 [Sphingomonadales bacterium]|nr:hypothetical protein [Sphingomonadales bacterium]|tara:strand:- start:3002 stop:3310 length:309 start_codon:yes stop_codon:yes gene_type:complete
MADDISISINEQSHPILCGTCQQPIAFIGESNTDTGKAGCVPCDNIADIQEVLKMVAEYAKDEGQLMFNRMARDVARQSKIMSFEGQTSQNKAHRFVVDLKL